jgi:exopolysaccharide biosynthesis polyprenyl glycosylphosphotransferase
MERELGLLPRIPAAVMPDAARQADRDPASVARSRVSRGVAFASGRPVLVAADLIAMALATTAAGAAWGTTALWSVGLVLAQAPTGRYRARLRHPALSGVPSTLLGLAVIVAATACLRLPVALTPPAFSGRVAVWLGLALASLLTARALADRWLCWRRARHAGLPTLVVGSGDVGIRLAEELRAEPGLGLAPVGLVGAAPVLRRRLPAPLLGPVEDLDAVVGAHRPRAIVVAFGDAPDAELVAALRRCRRSGVLVYLVPRLFELPVGHPDAELVGGIPLIRLRPEPANRWRRGAKRLLDIAGALVGLVLLAPVFAACALAVRCESGRGVLFRQERIGRSGKPFTIMKFRSLTPASTVESQVRWSIAHDARVGPVGRVLRGTSLDELPQLVNVLRGEMSLVGPRPERPFFVEQFQRAYAGYGDRHRVPAGITGWAQIHGLRGDTSIEDRVRYDNYYVENWSLGLDLKIIARTVGSMLSIRRR